MAVPVEEKKTSKMVYDGKMIKVTYDTVSIEGREAWREVVHHPGASAVVCVRDDGAIVFERQYRYAIGRSLLEIPAGKLDKGEDPLTCAKRELAEETGFRCSHWEELGTIATSAGFSNEEIHLFLATGLTKGPLHLDADEHIELEFHPITEAMDLLTKEPVKDTKTLSALLLALPKLIK